MGTFTTGVKLGGAAGRRRAYLELGRVSNLPTVWSNVLAGATLAGARGLSARLAALAGALSLLYVGGMFLNDAADHEVDARERRDRPIPSGRVSAREAWGTGFALLLGGLVTLAVLAALAARSTDSGIEPTGEWWRGVAAGGVLAALIILYDLRHKANPLSPVLMGLCRSMVYVVAALAMTGAVTLSVLGGAVALLAYLVGLTYAAKQETLAALRGVWPLAFLLVPLAYALPLIAVSSLAVIIFAAFTVWMLAALATLVRRNPGQPGRPGGIGRAVAALIAGISLLDGTLIAASGAPHAALVAVACFGLTLLFQRHVPGT